MANQSEMRPQIATVPLGYPTEPTVGTISLLFSANSSRLYNQFSPMGYDNGEIFGFGQPYTWHNIGERTPIGVPILSTVFSGARDVVRISKFIASGRGVLFLGKQFLLQGFQTYNETKLYNPIETVMATVSNTSLGLIPPPQRHIDLSGGLLGALASVIGFNSEHGTQPPSGTMGLVALSSTNQDQGKGLLRAVTGQAGQASLQCKWKASSGPISGGFMSAVGNYFKSALSKLVGGLLPAKKPEGLYRADDNTYDLMIDNDGFRLKYMSVDTPNYFVEKKYGKASPKFASINSTAGTTDKKVSDNIIFLRKSDSKYEDDFTPDFLPMVEDLWTKIYKDNNLKTGLKFNDGESEKVKIINDGLRKIISNLQGASYTVLLDTQTQTMTNPDDPYPGYQRQKDRASSSNGSSGTKGGYSQEYLGRTRTLRDFNDIRNTYKFASSNKSDGINRLTVLDNTRDLKNQNLGSEFAGWDRWEPYEDDLIAFFFYDIVNEKYIPFRATVKGINESNNAMWDELTFIGRADKLYSYSGFTRNLSFTFQVVIGSVKELMPTWSRINYLKSSIKPSNYTKSSGKNYNRFMIPPMFQITIGDLYKRQPVVITTVNVVIPENATWELLPSEQAAQFDWNYLNKQIQLKGSTDQYGQLPLEAEISITCNILEIDIPVVGDYLPPDDTVSAVQPTDEFLTTDSPPVTKRTSVVPPSPSAPAPTWKPLPVPYGTNNINRVDKASSDVPTNFNTPSLRPVVPLPSGVRPF